MLESGQTQHGISENLSCLQRAKDRKTAVEECLAFDVNDLVAKAVFRAPFGLLCSYSWRDSSETEVFSVEFQVDADTDARGLHIKYKPPGCPKTIMGRLEFGAVRCHFGGAKRMFKCSGKGNGCGRLVQKLYLIGSAWLCRNCGDLTYIACREHDRRKDFLIRNPAALVAVLGSKNPNEMLLGIGAYAHTVRKLAKSSSRSESKTWTAFPPVLD